MQSILGETIARVFTPNLVILLSSTAASKVSYRLSYMRNHGDNQFVLCRKTRGVGKDKRNEGYVDRERQERIEEGQIEVGREKGGGGGGGEGERETKKERERQRNSCN